MATVGVLQPQPVALQGGQLLRPLAQQSDVGHRAQAHAEQATHRADADDGDAHQNGQFSSSSRNAANSSSFIG